MLLFDIGYDIMPPNIIEYTYIPRYRRHTLAGPSLGANVSKIDAPPYRDLYIYIYNKSFLFYTEFKKYRKKNAITQRLYACAFSTCFFVFVRDDGFAVDLISV